MRKTHPHADDVNGLIETRLADAERERLRLLTAREVVTAEALKNAVLGRGHTEDFLGFARSFLEDVEKRGEVRRSRKERAVLAKLEEFGGSPLPFRRLTVAFLDRWTAWLMAEKKNKASTVAAAITVVRLHYNRAVRHGVVAAADSPFPVYKPPKPAKPERTKLTAAQVASIEGLDLGQAGPNGSGKAKVRDWFLFSLYTQGMRFADVMQLRRRNVTREEEGDGTVYRVTYRMGKTTKTNSVLLVPQSLAIIEPYLQRGGGPDEYLFDALDGYDTATAKGLTNALSSRNAYANKLLRQIAKRAGIGAPVSFHCARHTFADLARKGGWSVYDVSRALRHSDLRITDGYLAGFDADALDERMRGLFGSDESGVGSGVGVATRT